jgi:hypothetical protein
MHNNIIYVEKLSICTFFYAIKRVVHDRNIMNFNYRTLETLN